MSPARNPHRHQIAAGVGWFLVAVAIVLGLEFLALKGIVDLTSILGAVLLGVGAAGAVALLAVAAVRRDYDLVAMRASLERLANDSALSRAGLTALARSHQSSTKEAIRLARAGERAVAAALAARVTAEDIAVAVDPFVVAALLVLAPGGHVLLCGDEDWAQTTRATLASLSPSTTAERLDPEHSGTLLSRRAARAPDRPPIFVAQTASEVRELASGQPAQLVTELFPGRPYLVIAPTPLHYAAEPREGEPGTRVERLGAAALLLTPIER